MRIDLTIKKDYLPNWGLWEGIRELVQNGRDAEMEYGAKLEVDWFNGNLRIENDGCTLPRRALLLGETSKADRDDLIGQFGEGLKLGILALVRLGRRVVVRTGGEVWKPSLRHSDEFGAEVLSFQIQGGREAQNRVRVEIECSKEEWQSVRDRFLFLCRETENDRVETNHGTLLVAQRFQGRLYVKGIFVSHDTSLNYGYDMFHAKLDRDRKMVDSWDLQRDTACILGSSVAQRPDLLDPLFKLLEKSANDVRGINQYSTDYIPNSVSEQITAKFTARYGEDAVPVENLAESKDIEHLGKKGVVLPAGLRVLVSKNIGSLEEVKRRLSEEVKKTCSWSDLSQAEQKNLERAVELVGVVSACTINDVDVVDFRSSSLLGQHKNGRYLLARKILADRSSSLETLVHEVAHNSGADGDKGHVAEIERMWAGIVEHLTK